MTTPAPNLVLHVSLDKPSYKRGDPITATLDLVAMDPLTVTASGTDAGGNTVNGQASASVESPPAEPVTFGISDSLGTGYSQQSAGGGSAVMTGTLGTATVA